jgi:rRNA-processing protein FCF1
MLLLAVGLWNPQAIKTHKRLSDFTAGDFDLLRNYLGAFDRLLTTPHVLTEVSNLAGAAFGQSRIAIFQQIASLCDTLEEHTMAADILTKRPEFSIFGLTDAALSLLSAETALLTQDGRLARHLRIQGLSVMTLQDVKVLRNRANYA